ncbi:kinesin-like protein [Phytophthora cinnamomi]|uniref:kinesin-like protein n=1 Tax=Phytophthora cinnamomi TaxID=4785 RepID=UPI00355A6B42|nr:kinesin-like protein [Phytophthora cinnamomi]
MLRERNTFVLKARSGRDERQHALTLNVNVRAQDLGHFNGSNGAGGAKAVQRLLGVLDDDEAFQALVREMDDLRQLDALVKAKAKDGSHTLELPDMTVQWQVAEEPGLPSVLQRVQIEGTASASVAAAGRGGPAPADGDGGRYRPLPVRKLVVAVWLYPPHVEIPPTGERIPIGDADTQDFFVGMDDDDDSVEDVEE